MISDQKNFMSHVPNANLYFFQRLHELQLILLDDKIAIKPHHLTGNIATYAAWIPAILIIYGLQNGQKKL